MSLIEKLDSGVNSILNIDIESLSDVTLLTSLIGGIGLFYDSRNIYGDDTKYMLPPNNDKNGLWQTPIQLAKFLIGRKDKGIKTYLDIGTLTGWTTTVITAYLSRFGLQYVDTFDIYYLCSEEVQSIWKKYSLPINYIVTHHEQQLSVIKKEYDMIFIDGNHEYSNVRLDYERFRTMSKMLVFHDINDNFCRGVVRIWEEVKKENEGSAKFYEYIEHPNNLRLMGIGVVELD